MDNGYAQTCALTLPAPEAEKLCQRAKASRVMAKLKIEIYTIPSAFVQSGAAHVMVRAETDVDLGIGVGFLRALSDLGEENKPQASTPFVCPHGQDCVHECPDPPVGTTQKRLDQVRQFVQERRAYAAQATAVAQEMERGGGPIRLISDKDRSHVIREVRAEAAQADTAASAVESALSILF